MRFVNDQIIWARAPTFEIKRGALLFGLKNTYPMSVRIKNLNGLRAVRNLVGAVLSRGKAKPGERKENYKNMPIQRNAPIRWQRL